jgi:hypothetical protein
MKTMIKQRGFFAVLAVALLVTAMLVTTCMDPMGGGSGVQGDGTDNYRAPEGMGYIRLNLSNERSTIMPGTPTVASLYYRVQFTETTAGNDTSNNKTVPVTTADPMSYTDLTTTAINLAGGPIATPLTYDVELFAFNRVEIVTAPGTYEFLPVTSGKPASDVSIVTGAGINTVINLVGKTDGTGNGRFTYNVTAPTIPTTLDTAATLDVFVYPAFTGTSALGGVITLSQGVNNTATVNLPSGFYNVVITFNATNYHKIVIERMLHIYEGLYSEMPLLTVPALTKNGYDVSYNHNESGTPTVTQDVDNPHAHGSVVSNDFSGDPPENINNVTVEKTGSTFLRWSLGTNLSDTTGFAFGTGGKRIISDITLYALWQDGTDGTLSFPSVTFTPILDATPVIPLTANISQADYYDSGTAIPITITLTNATDYTGIYWRYNETTYSVDEFHLDGTGDISYLAAGPHYFTVYATAGGITYSNTFVLTVAP